MEMGGVKNGGRGEGEGNRLCGLVRVGGLRVV
jgi:hypothetical protein